MRGWHACSSRGCKSSAVVMPGPDPGIHPLRRTFSKDGLPGQVFSPGTSRTGVRGHDRHIIMHGFGGWGDQIHAMDRGVGDGSTARVCAACNAGRSEPAGALPAVRHSPGHRLQMAQPAGRPIGSSPTDRAVRTRARSGPSTELKSASLQCATLIRHGGLARLPGVWNAGAGSRRRFRRCTRFCVGLAVSNHPLEAQRPTNVLKCRRQICCGRWTSKAGYGLATTRAAIP